MPRITYPKDPDAWSESLNPAEGNWSAIAGEVDLDRMNKAVGEASIRTWAVGYIYYEASIFTLHDGKEFDATRKDAKIHFLHALDAAHNGNCSLILYDRADRGASRLFGTAPNAEWEIKEFPVGPGTGWDEEAGFDWSHVKKIRIDCWENYRQAGSFWVDSPHFSYEVVRPKLRIESSPTGKHFEIDGLGAYTPFTIWVDPDTPYTVSMDTEGFKNWEDGSTDPKRTITLGEGEEKTITAYYTVIPPIPPIPEWVWWALGLAGFGAALGTVIYVTLPKE